ncbi:MFS transporter [Actinomadura verrucosospora]|uniref:Major facilitator superfamily multidrug resistance protein n=1 Tax=Actinomadura verrucosospora TaxID=46165 RepID=A0A7D4A564_ACTVE|nr:MFS transporter [Actinomadura verrucosospora]QKG22825.1 major facilitator superfamily multidrug resistance protein [Actinomadura verrucosospora]
MAIASPAPSGGARWLPVASIMFGVGWGANQFASLLGLYTERLHLGSGGAQAMFGVYALGLVPGLVLGGPASDRYGRRRIALPFACLSALVTLVLMAGVGAPWLLYAGRLLAGVVTGAVLAAGTAWVKELTPVSGTRMTALAVSAGFGAGPLASALVAQWAPHPLVTAYLPHLLIMLLTVPPAFRVPETRVARGPDGAGRQRFALSGVRNPAFRRTIAPVAVWTFAAPVSAFALLPAFVPVHHLPIAYAGAITGLTLASGMAAQPVARRLEARHPRLVARAGLGAITCGLLLAALTIAAGLPVLNAVTAVVLGAGYGFVLTYGLGEVARIAAPDELAGLTAVAYALVYVGMFAPLLLTVLAKAVPLGAVLTAMAVLAAGCLAYVSRQAPAARAAGPDAGTRPDVRECSAGR